MEKFKLSHNTNCPIIGELTLRLTDMEGGGGAGRMDGGQEVERGSSEKNW